MEIVARSTTVQVFGQFTGAILECVCCLQDAFAFFCSATRIVRALFSDRCLLHSAGSDRCGEPRHFAAES